MASARRKKAKSRPVTSGSKPGTPGPTVNLNLNLAVDAEESNAKSYSESSEPESAVIDLTAQLPTSSSSSSARKIEEADTESVLNVIGTPAFPSQPSSTPAPIPESKPEGNVTIRIPSPPPASQTAPVTTPKRPEPAAPAPFRDNEEFIAFGTPDSDEETAAIPIREWDQGKETMHAERRGKKRKSSEMARDDREYDRGGRRDRDQRRDRDRDRYRDRDRDRDGERRQRMENVPRYAPWVANMDWDKCTNVPELLHKEVEAFVEYVSPTKAEDEVRELIVTLVTRAVVRNFPDAKIFPFGSFETKLYLPSGVPVI